MWVRRFGRSYKKRKACIIWVDVRMYITYILTMATKIKRIGIAALLALRLFSATSDASALDMPGGYRRRQALSATVNV